MGGTQTRTERDSVSKKRIRERKESSEWKRKSAKQWFYRSRSLAGITQIWEGKKTEEKEEWKSLLRSQTKAAESEQQANLRPNHGVSGIGKRGRRRRGMEQRSARGEL